MGIIKAIKLTYDYIKRDEEGSPTGVNRAVDHVDIDIASGEFVAVLGHNGSGKSTLAKHMNALLLPTEGTIWVGEKDTADEDNLWDVRRTAGMVFQNPDNQGLKLLYYGMETGDDITLQAVKKGVSGEEAVEAGHRWEVASSHRYGYYQPPERTPYQYT